MTFIEYMIASVSATRIKCVFDVTYELDLTGQGRQYVTLLEDGSYVCTCLLQNQGLVCRHYFHMRVDVGCKYYIKLVARRWFTEEMQDSDDAQTSLVPFLRTYKQQACVGDEDVEIPALRI